MKQPVEVKKGWSGLWSTRERAAREQRFIPSLACPGQTCAVPHAARELGVHVPGGARPGAPGELLSPEAPAALGALSAGLGTAGWRL